MLRNPRTRRAAIALATSVVTGIGLATPAQAAEVYPRPVDGWLTITGRGYGHGTGMSQYGAMNAARQGKTWRQIIAHYYPGAPLGGQADKGILVGVEGRLGATARFKAEPGLVADDGRGQVIPLATADGGVAIAHWEVGLTQNPASTRAVLWFVRADGVRKPLRVAWSDRWTVRAKDATVTALGANGKAAATYLGSFCGIRIGTSIQPVVGTTLENYLRQVVPFESPGSWPKEALAAQAVAARSYASSYMGRWRNRNYTICDTTACQVFGGITNETTNSRAGIAASRGAIVTSGGRPATTMFGSSNGGQTTKANASYLVAKADPFEDGLPAAANTWNIKVPATTFEAKYPSIGRYLRLVVLSRDGRGYWGGRVTQVRLEGDRGSVTLTGSQLRSLIGNTIMRSTYFTPTGPRQ